jgi:nucleoid DNA-binding protein
VTASTDLTALTLPQLHELQGLVARAISLHPDLKGHPMGNKATKADLIHDLAHNHGMTQAAATRAVDAVLSYITTVVGARGTVALQGFGTFEPRFRQARTGRNPKTGEPVEIAASTSVGFRPSKRAGK